MRLVWGSVVEVARERTGAQRLRVRADGDEGESYALCYPQLTGACDPGDRVLLNTTAVDLSLGTGGAHVVIARAPAGVAPSGVALDSPSGGHVMKLRYTPLQVDVVSVEAPESPAHAALEHAVSVEGMPVVCCALHSHVAIVAAAVRERVPDARIAYVMTDEAALPMALSDVVAACVDTGLIDFTVTAGQAFGGTYEAVTLPSALVAARAVGSADVAIVAIGPGVVGTGTALGHGGVAQGTAINAVAAVGGRAVASLRMSFADARERHRGVSHHALTTLGAVALAPAIVAVPALGAAEAARIADELAVAAVTDRHDIRVVEAAMPDMRGVPTRSMGRDYADDPAFFLAAAAAGALAAELLVRD